MARRRKRAEKAERLHRAVEVREAAYMLSTGYPTKWRWYSECRHAIRATKCLKGWPWQKADEYAASVVRLAAIRIGLTLPTWSMLQGQWETRVYYYCVQCRGRMPEGSDRPWCSDDCRWGWHGTRLGREYRAMGEALLIRRRLREAAAEGIRGPESRERSCKHCGRLFVGADPATRYCSYSCAASSVRREMADCAICGTRFRRYKAGHVTCSPACQGEHRRRKYLEHATARDAAKPRESACIVCGTIFPYRVNGGGRRSPYCSTACKSKEHYARRVEREGAAAD